MRRKKRKKIYFNKKVRSRKKVNYFKILSIFLIAILLVSTPIFIKKLVVIKSINCTSQYGECPEELMITVSTVVNSDLKSTKKQLSEILKDSFLVENFLIQYKLPSTIELDIVVKKPKFAIKDKNSNTYYLLDRDGVVLEQNSLTNIPFVSVQGTKLIMGEKAPDKLIFANQIMYEFNWLYKIDGGEIVDDGLFVQLESGHLVIFPLQGDVDSLIGAIRLINSRLNESNNGIRMENVHEIDLRFKNPVIR